MVFSSSLMIFLHSLWYFPFLRVVGIHKIEFIVFNIKQILEEGDIAV